MSLSVLSVATYIASTYDASASLRGLDLALAVVFIAEWSFYLWLAEIRTRFLLSPRSLIDLVTCVPMFVSYSPDIDPSTASAFLLVRILRVFRILRVLRLMRLGQQLGTEIQQRLFALAFTILSTTLVAAGIFYEVEGRFSVRNDGVQFHTALYWSFVTIATLGYGDVTPSLTVTRLLVVAELFLVLTLLPVQTSKLVLAFNYSSPYLRARYYPVHGPHVVVTGAFDLRSALRFVAEFFHLSLIHI